MQKPLKSVTDVQLMEARRIAARLVQDCGDQYWPILMRVNRELEARKSRADILKECLSGTATTDHAQNRTI